MFVASMCTIIYLDASKLLPVTWSSHLDWHDTIISPYRRPWSQVDQSCCPMDPTIPCFFLGMFCFVGVWFRLKPSLLPHPLISSIYFNQFRSMFRSRGFGLKPPPANGNFRTLNGSILPYGTYVVETSTLGTWNGYWTSKNQPISKRSRSGIAVSCLMLCESHAPFS